MSARTAVIVRGGWEGHHPVEATDLFVPFLRAEGFDVRIENGPAVYADAAAMAGTDLVVQAVSMGEITDAEVAGLRAAIEAGTGMVGWHGGIVDAFRSSLAYLQLVGAQFVAHPGDPAGGHPTHRYEVTGAGRAHPITAGLADFALTTEQYWVVHDDLIDVLATTTLARSEGSAWRRPVVSPAVWTRSWGAGRLAALTPGHDPEVLAHPAVRTLVERAILWAARACV